MSADEKVEVAPEEIPESDASQGGWSVWAQLGLGLLVIVGGGVVAGAMIMAQGSEEQVAPELEPVPVEALVVRPAPHPVTVETTGTVTAAKQISVVPQVQGRLTYVSDQLQPGGRFAKGEVMARIDRRDYALAVEQRRSDVQSAEVNLALEMGRQETAQREWELLGNSGAPPDLAARKPQLQSAKLSLESAKSGLKTAQLNLERATLRAPFNAIVLSESVDVGQVVGATTNVATLSGTDTLWVQVSVPVERLGNIDIPGANATEGSSARVVQALGREQIVREGHVLRLSGQLDQQSRTATVLVEVEDPFHLGGLAEGEMPGLPMLPGAFVDVTLTGRTVPDAIEVPRVAVNDNRYVWLVEDDKLHRQDVQIGWGSTDNVYVTGGLEAGEQIVVTSLSFPIEGMPVTVQGQASAALNGEK